MESLTDSEKFQERALLVRIYVPSYKAFDIPHRDFSSSNSNEPDKILRDFLLNTKEDDIFVNEIQKVILPLSRSFFGRFYTIQSGRIKAESIWPEIEQTIRGNQRLVRILVNLKQKGSCSQISLAKSVKGLGPDQAKDLCMALEKVGIIDRSFEFDDYCKWEIKEENLSLVDMILEKKESPRVEKAVLKRPESGLRPAEETILSEEMKLIAVMDAEFDTYLDGLLKNRLETTIRFGKTFSAFILSEYLRSLFGPNLFFDSVLTIGQQYSLCDVPVHSAKGFSGIRTGFNLALFGEPGTGKSYSTRDMILGKEGSVEPHGLLGRNRYAGGITPARFIRLGQAYENRRFNFIVPEFNDWFRYEGMVEPLKIAMERGDIKYETQRETIGPYKFSSFFSVNYNTSVFGKGYEVTIRDPNFSAIEDRMVCRLHRLTKQRFSEIAESQRRIAMGESGFGRTPELIRDHLTLVYAVQTKHPLVRNLYSQKNVMLTESTYDSISDARNLILSHIPGSSVPFSARLEERAIRLAASLSLLKFFGTEGPSAYVPISEDALRFAVQFYVEEASIRSGERFNPADVLSEMSVETDAVI